MKKKQTLKGMDDLLITDENLMLLTIEVHKHLCCLYFMSEFENGEESAEQKDRKKRAQSLASASSIFGVLDVEEKKKMIMKLRTELKELKERK